MPPMLIGPRGTMNRETKEELPTLHRAHAASHVVGNLFPGIHRRHAGWGQAATGRSVTGAVFVTWEGVTAMMTLKAQAETHYLKESGSKNLSAKRQEVQDWLVLWIFNHLFSGAEAYVSAHLQDFPRELKVQAVPGGIRVSVPAPRP